MYVCTYVRTYVLWSYSFFNFILWCFPFQGISSSAQLLANSSEETPVLSPLAPVSLLSSSKGEDQKQKVVTKPEKVQAILKAIKQVWDALSLFVIDCFWFSSWFSYIKGMFDKPEKLYIECILFEKILILSAEKCIKENL